MKNLSFVSLSDYTSPQIIEDRTKDWVKYGEDNNYYQYLVDLYRTSPTNNACIKGTADLMYGRGLDVIRANRHLKGYLEFTKLFDQECIQKICLDLKMLGKASFQVVKNKQGSKYAKAYHFPIQTLRDKKANERGEITGYYYHPDWAKIKRNEQPKEFAAFGFDKSAKECILVIQPYVTGSFYYAPVDYQGGTQWAELEAEIANYHLNNIKNGLAPSMLINFNNGEPPEEMKYQIEDSIKSKFSGSSNAGRFIISWNDGQDTKADITPVPLSDAHNQYQFLSTECMQKVMLSHRITSPMLLGIKDNTGFGNNAEEIEKSSILFDNTVIRPFQDLIIKAVKKVLNANETPVDLYFKTLQPLEFTDLSGLEVDKTTEEKELGFSTNLSSHIEMTEEDEIGWLEFLGDKGEIIDPDLWEEIEEVLVDPELEEPTTKLLSQYSEPDNKSADDKGIYKIRYRYGPNSVKDNSRHFCKQMVSARNRNVVYRREDIDLMGERGVNNQFSPKGKSTYSIWRFKGGVYCHHAWYRVTFRRKYEAGRGNMPIPLTPEEKASNKRDMDNYNPVSNAEANAKGVPFAPPNWKEAKTRTIDMPSRGRYEK
jgi:hypothetical protein